MASSQTIPTKQNNCNNEWITKYEMLRDQVTQISLSFAYQVGLVEVINLVIKQGNG